MSLGKTGGEVHGYGVASASIIHGVRATASREAVVTEATDDEIVSKSTVDDVGLPIARQAVIAGASIEVFYPCEGVTPRSTGSGAEREVSDDGLRGTGEICSVATRTADDLIIAKTAIDDVVSTATIDAVGLCVTGQDVIARTPNEILVVEQAVSPLTGRQFA